MRERHLPEWAKNVLIAALSLSALFLFSLSPLYLNSPLSEWTKRSRSTASAAPGESVSFSAAARPARMAVNNSAGRFGVQYDHDAVDALFNQTGALLGEALGSAGAARPISEDRWRQALRGEGIYFDFAGTIPLAALAGWLRDGERNDLLSGDIRRVVLAGGEDGAVWLYYQDGWEESDFYGRATALQVQAHLDPVTASYVPNGAKFAFEDAGLRCLGAYTFITDGPDRAPVYEASSPLAAGGTALDNALSALSFSGALVASYAADDGTVYRLGEDSLLLAPDGSLTYHGGDGTLYPVACEGSSPTMAEMIEATRKLTASVLEPLCGEARVYLVSAVEEDGTVRISYGYSLNGAAVWTGKSGRCAQFTLKEGELTGFVLRPRSYTALERMTPLLPVVQAAAALEAKDAVGSELLLLYRDTGDGEARCGWIAG